MQASLSTRATLARRATDAGAPWLLLLLAACCSHTASRSRPQSREPVKQQQQAKAQWQQSTHAGQALEFRPTRVNGEAAQSTGARLAGSFRIEAFRSVERL
jgi:outer membrane biogenesis lipoprotein LolB